MDHTRLLIVNRRLVNRIGASDEHCAISEGCREVGAVVGIVQALQLIESGNDITPQILSNGHWLDGIAMVIEVERSGDAGNGLVWFGESGQIVAKTMALMGETRCRAQITDRRD